LREVCDIEEEQKPYHPTQLTRFRNRIGVERLEKIMNTLIDELIESYARRWSLSTKRKLNWLRGRTAPSLTGATRLKCYCAKA